MGGDLSSTPFAASTYKICINSLYFLCKGTTHHFSAFSNLIRCFFAWGNLGSMVLASRRDKGLISISLPTPNPRKQKIFWGKLRAYNGRIRRRLPPNPRVGIIIRTIMIDIDRWFRPWWCVGGCGVASSHGFGRHHDRQ